MNDGVVDGVGLEDSVLIDETVETAVLVELWLIEGIDVSVINVVWLALDVSVTKAL